MSVKEKNKPKDMTHYRA